jgi:hypothetical protein
MKKSTNYSVAAVVHAPSVVTSYMATRLAREKAYIVNADGTVTMASEARTLTGWQK